MNMFWLDPVQLRLGSGGERPRGTSTYPVYRGKAKAVALQCPDWQDEQRREEEAAHENQYGLWAEDDISPAISATFSSPRQLGFAAES
jgi:hypothetical protein